MNSRNQFESFDSSAQKVSEPLQELSASLSDPSANELIMKMRSGESKSQSVLDDSGILSFPDLDAFSTDNDTTRKAAKEPDLLAAANSLEAEKAPVGIYKDIFDTMSAINKFMSETCGTVAESFGIKDS